MGWIVAGIGSTGEDREDDRTDVPRARTETRRGRMEEIRPMKTPSLAHARSSMTQHQVVRLILNANGDPSLGARFSTGSARRPPDFTPDWPYAEMNCKWRASAHLRAIWLSDARKCKRRRG